VGMAPSNNFRSASPEAKFWDWFAANSERLANFEADQERIFDELAAELEKVHEGLTFEFGPEEPDGREFVVSADGIRERFPAVIRLVEAAPDLPGWKIIAFRQPKSMDYSLEYGGYELSPDDIWFAAEPDGDRVGLNLYIKGLSRANERVATGAAFFLLDGALGEYDVETKIGFIEFKPLPSKPASRGLQPLRELPAVVQQMVQRLKPRPM
jgi:hypothetical protein